MSNVISDEQSKELVAHNVNRLLEKQGHSRYWLAKQTGEWNSTIANVCTAKKCCGAGLLARIAEALGVGIDELFSPVRKKYPKVS